MLQKKKPTYCKNNCFKGNTVNNFAHIILHHTASHQFVKKNHTSWNTYKIIYRFLTWKREIYAE